MEAFDEVQTHTLQVFYRLRVRQVNHCAMPPHFYDHKLISTTLQKKS